MSTKKIQVIGSIVPQSDWAQTDETKQDYVKNKPDLSAYAPAYTSGTTDLTAGSSSLATGTLHFVYE